MKNINNVEEFKEYIKKDSSCEDIFWGDTWAISTLERLLKIKLILLSEENYRNQDLNNVLQCGQLNDSILENEGVFRPDYYIILDYNGYHYKLILFKKHTAFKFSELPYSIKELVVIRCLEKSSGPFYIIPEFKEFAENYNSEIKFFKEDIELEKPSSLYDENIVFQYYIKSNNKPKPGQGNGEKIPNDKVKDFVELSKIDNWRKKLSNLWDKNVIVINGKNWKSVEHYYQANKFKNNPEYYDTFSLDSNSELSKDPILAKEAGTESSKTRPKNITIDPNFNKNKDTILEEALFAKFTQNDELKKVIMSTKNAKLKIYQLGNKALISDNLMKVRSKILS